MKRILLTLLAVFLASTVGYAATVKLEEARNATSSNNDQLIKTGGTIVYAVSVMGTDAGDTATFYDALTATGTPKIEIKVGTAADSKQLSISGGVRFSTGVYVDVTDGDVAYSIIYE